MDRIKAAGGVVLNNNKILFIYKRDKWDLPKGKVKENDTDEETALIEVVEETGVNYNQLKIISRLVPTSHIKNYDHKQFIKKTQWYLMNYYGDNKTSLIPDLSEGITECKWIDSNKLNNVYKNTLPRVTYLLDFFLSSNIKY